MRGYVCGTATATAPRTKRGLNAPPPSQPLPGLSDRHCTEDQEALALVVDANPTGQPLVVADCRSKVGVVTLTLTLTLTTRSGRLPLEGGNII